MNRKIYICHPLAGDIQGNIEKVRYFAREIALAGDIPVVPHFIALFLNDSIPEERELGIRISTQMLLESDEMQIFSERLTPGMVDEIQICNEHKIKFYQKKYTGGELCHQV